MYLLLPTQEHCQHILVHGSSIFAPVRGTRVLDLRTVRLLQHNLIAQMEALIRESSNLESSIARDIPDSPPTCTSFTINSMPEHDLDILGVGASGQVYNVSDQVVLKTRRLYAPPGSDAPQSDFLHYASETLFSFGLLRDERTVLRLLQDKPHPHIIQAIDLDQPEGLYLRKYQEVSEGAKSTQARRIRLYRDIADALRHLHSLGIVHADLRIDNVLVDDCSSAILCDFSAASPCGDRNFVFPDYPLPINGPSPVLSEASDMFALASLMSHMEHGLTSKPSIENGRLVLPETKSGNQRIDEIIQAAWLGKYSHTSEMVRHLASIDAEMNHDAETTEVLRDLGDLKIEVTEWRNNRKNKFGKVNPYCVLKPTAPSAN